MFYNSVMDGLAKLAQLKTMMDVEKAEETSIGHAVVDNVPGCPAQTCVPGSKPNLADEYPITYAALPNGKRIALLKSLQTSACERNCYYCCFRAGRDFHRQTFQPDELAQTFLQLVHARVVEGIFLSSGVAGGGVHTQDRLLATAEILRHKLAFKGYLHLKLMPGLERDQVEQAMRLADRVSINLEAPTDSRLAMLAPMKVFIQELLQPLRWVEEIRRSQSPQKTWNGRWPSSVTQFVVGGAGESDLELLQTTSWLNQNVYLSRAYYSGFNPVPDTPLENVPAVNPWREHRLYQASFLLRDYGFAFEELAFDPGGNLSLETDPKMGWAQQNLSQSPLEINHADYPQLLRVPGIGPLRARAILAARRQGHLRTLKDLKALGVATGRAAPFILLDGQRMASQPRLF
jgi:predicted DNA-binding helix-hairpin-helix protein